MFASSLFIFSIEDSLDRLLTAGEDTAEGRKSHDAGTLGLAGVAGEVATTKGSSEKGFICTASTLSWFHQSEIVVWKGFFFSENGFTVPLLSHSSWDPWERSVLKSRFCWYLRQGWTGSLAFTYGTSRKSPSSSPGSSWASSAVPLQHPEVQ